jgi:hypothetical protein
MKSLFYTIGQTGVNVWESGTKESTSHDVIFDTVGQMGVSVGEWD